MIDLVLFSALIMLGGDEVIPLKKMLKHAFWLWLCTYLETCLKHN